MKGRLQSISNFFNRNDFADITSTYFYAKSIYWRSWNRIWCKLSPSFRLSSFHRIFYALWIENASGWGKNLVLLRGVFGLLYIYVYIAFVYLCPYCYSCRKILFLIPCELSILRFFSQYQYIYMNRGLWTLWTNKGFSICSNIWNSVSAISIDLFSHIF